MGTGGDHYLLVLGVYVLHQPLAVRRSNYLIILAVDKQNGDAEVHPLLEVNPERIVLRAELAAQDPRKRFLH